MLRSFRRVFRACFLLSLLALPAVVAAHEGHDDAPPPAAGPAPVPTLEATGSDVELVAVLKAGHLILYLDRYATNEPVIGADVSVSIDGGAEVRPEALPDGSYLLEAEELHGPTHELVVTVAAGDVSDLLIGSLAVPEAADADDDHDAPVLPGWPLLLAAFAAGVAATVLLAVLAGRRRSAGLAAVLLLGVVLTASLPAAAHEGHDHGDEGPVQALPDQPRRLPDGSLFVPKRTQRLLGVRTLPAEITRARSSHSLVGRIIADPNASGRVQASEVGRVEAPEDGLPYVGQKVEAGQVLAYIVPAIAAGERGTLSEQMASIDKEIVVARQQLDRLSRLKGTVAQKEIDDAKAVLAGLQRQRKALSPVLEVREPLRAPVSGIIAAADAVPGQVIDDRDQTVLFEIVDPGRLLVEAVAFDPAAAQDIVAATATGDDGAVLKLGLLGTGPARRGQAVPLLFRVEAGGEGRHPGAPVRVQVSGTAQVEGIVLPREAVVRGPAGLPVVWEHVSPQRFEPRTVRYRPLDGASVLVEAGLEPGSRIVTAGAALLTQVR
ncbi:efflux RND transporter periplasmic adaptor subunit [Rhodocista pekingensis]|uniref:Efflux RND transporter periplasmic adaptor subunit n=1 Tax=Rhodocista pekingensis TaxID=201185 RepID=A0ABW2KQZ3_9PROT